jgi:hypothetical protein
MTKTAMCKEVFASTCGRHSHPAMERFDAAEFHKSLENEFGDAFEEGHLPFEHESCDLEGERANWYEVYLGYGKLQDHTTRLVRAAIACGLLVYDNQREAAYNNRRPTKKK